MGEESPDWTVVARNIRQSRLLRGFSQEELARLAGLGASTIHHAERGRPIRPSSIRRISEVLGESVADLERRDRRNLTSDLGFVMSRRAEEVWTPSEDARARIPPDNFDRVQDPGERERLGRLGMVPAFFTTPNLVMPSGPGLISIELYRRFTEALNHRIYRFALLRCDVGRARVGLGEEVVTLESGDIAGFRTERLAWMEPAEDAALPVRLSWTGAERIGGLSLEASGSQRVRRASPP